MGVPGTAFGEVRLRDRSQMDIDGERYHNFELECSSYAHATLRPPLVSNQETIPACSSKITRSQLVLAILDPRDALCTKNSIMSSI